jgi:glycosyltransferase involved in cell wall biosynthesis
VTSVLVFPRDSNPYQELLYRCLSDRGVATRYVPWPSRSHSLNLALVPLWLAWGRLRGAAILHLHWVYPFALPVRNPMVRGLSAVWFAVVLHTAKLVGLRLVWTAHNVLPHTPVFADDARQRRRLVAAADAVVVHSPATYPDAVPRDQARRRLGVASDADLVLFFGRVSPYKGVEDLIGVWPSVRSLMPQAELVVAGACADTAMRQRLEAAAGPGAGMRMVLGEVPDELLPVLFGAADLVCLPFRAVTTSGSAVLAAGFGRALLIPDLEELSNLPRGTVLRYRPGTDGLRDGVLAALTRGRADLDRLGAEARQAVATSSWDDAADAHARLFASLSDTRLRGQGPDMNDHNEVTNGVAAT